MPNLTTTYEFNKPLVNNATDADLWGAQLNTNWDGADQEFGADFVDVASASTTDIGAAASRNVRITGTTTITSFGTVNAGYTRRVRFADALTLTHNGTSLILPSAANITTATNDCLTAVSLGSGNWIVTNYQPAAMPASQALIEAETANAFADAAKAKFHPSAAKAWVIFTTSGGAVTIQDSYNVTSITDNGVGDYTINFTDAFSSANYAFALSASRAPSGGSRGAAAFQNSNTTPTASAFRMSVVDIDSGFLLIDPARASAVFYGELA